jgi:hypothetical protein
MKDWVVKLDPSNRVGREHREIYGYAGMALSQAQTLEHVLKNFIVLTRAIERGRDRQLSAKQFARFRAEIENFEAETFKKTLGPIIASIKKRFHFQTKPNLEIDLEKSLRDRNQLVHHFFWDRATETQSSEGRHKMADELRRIHKQLLQTIADFSDATKAIRQAMGITDENINEVVEAAKSGATEKELGELIQRQRLKLQRERDAISDARASALKSLEKEMR